MFRYTRFEGAIDLLYGNGGVRTAVDTVDCRFVVLEDRIFEMGKQIFRQVLME